MITAASTETRPTRQVPQHHRLQGWVHRPWDPSSPYAQSVRCAVAHTPTRRSCSVFTPSASAVWRRSRITGTRFRARSATRTPPWGPQVSAASFATSAWPASSKQRWPAPSTSSRLRAPVARAGSQARLPDVWRVQTFFAPAASWLIRFGILFIFFRELEIEDIYNMKHKLKS